MASPRIDVDHGLARMNEEMNNLGRLILFWLPPLPFLSGADDVAFPSGDITLRGVVYRPEGKGPFPAVVYNHGSAAGRRRSGTSQEQPPRRSRGGLLNPFHFFL